MGFLDNIQSTMNRGTAAAERTARKMKINQRLNEITRERQKLATQLGASLYEATRENPEFRTGREALYDGIASLDVERTNCQQELAAIEAAAAAEEAAAQTFVCTHCGARISATDLFCSSCGTSMETIKAEIAAQNPVAAPISASGRTCASCGAPMADDDIFCMNCGSKAEPAATAAPEEPAANTIPEEPAASTTPEEPTPLEPVPGEIPVSTPTEVTPVTAAPVDVAPASRICPTCGATLSDDSAFCGSCGTKIEA